MTSPLKAAANQPFRGCLQLLFRYSSNFFGSGVLLDLMRPSREGQMRWLLQGRLFNQQHKFAAGPAWERGWFWWLTHWHSPYLEDCVLSCSLCPLIWMFQMIDVTLEVQWSPQSLTTPRCIRLPPTAKPGITIGASKKSQKAFSQLNTVLLPLRAKKGPKTVGFLIISHCQWPPCHIVWPCSLPELLLSCPALKITFNHHCLLSTFYFCKNGRCLLTQRGVKNQLLFQQPIQPKYYSTSSHRITHH